MVLFGPDGNLWVSLGDGANASAQGQDPGTLFATISRLDVDGRPADGLPYAIPEDNPFVDGGGAPEVWAYGLRNPWRFTIDSKSVIVADVGSGAAGRGERPPVATRWLEPGVAHRRGDGLLRREPVRPEPVRRPRGRVRPRRGVRHHRRPRLPGQGDPRDQWSLLLSATGAPGSSAASGSPAERRSTARLDRATRGGRRGQRLRDRLRRRALPGVARRPGDDASWSRSVSRTVTARPDFSPSRNSPETRVRNRASDPEGGGGR